jgi:hypothetical protein
LRAAAAAREEKGDEAVAKGTQRTLKSIDSGDLSASDCCRLTADLQVIGCCDVQSTTRAFVPNGAVSYALDRFARSRPGRPSLSVNGRPHDGGVFANLMEGRREEYDDDCDGEEYDC